MGGKQDITKNVVKQENNSKVKDSGKKVNPTFDELVSMFKLSKAEACGIKSTLKISADNRIRESNFISSIKKFKEQVPR